MDTICRHYYPVSDKVPPEFRPLMACFMTYFLQTFDSKQSSKYLRHIEAMIRKLAEFIDPPAKPLKYRSFTYYMKDVPRTKIVNVLRKEDGTMMNSMEQFEFFAKFVSEKGYAADVYMFQQKCRHHLWKTNEHENSPFIIPVVRLLDGRFAATSCYNGFTFDLKNRLLKIESQKERKQKRINRHLTQRNIILLLKQQKITNFINP